MIESEIRNEVERAMKKFPTWPTDPIHAVAVIVEEVGELQKAVLQAVYEPNKGSRPNIRAEAIQAGAMCYRFLMSLDKYEYYHAKQHEQRLGCAACDRGDFQLGHADWCPEQGKVTK